MLCIRFYFTRSDFCSGVAWTTRISVMPAIRFSVAVMLFTLVRTATAQSGCADPTPNDFAWWRLTLLPRNPDGSVSMTAPQPPTQAKSFQFTACVVGTSSSSRTPLALIEVRPSVAS